MDRTARMTRVPPAQLAGLEKAIERIGGSAAKGRGAAVVAQTGEDEPTYGDIVDLAQDAGTFDLALKKAGADLPAGKVGRVRSVVQKFEADVPVCKRCGDLAVDVVGGEALIRSAGEACPGCGEYLEESEAAKPYVAWTTGREVPPTISYDFDTTPGIRVPLTDAAIRGQHEVSPALDALLAREGVTMIAFLLWLYHGPEKARFTRATHKVLRFLADPDAETGHSNVTRNWVRAAKGFVPPTAARHVAPEPAHGAVGRDTPGMLLANQEPFNEAEIEFAQNRYVILQDLLQECFTDPLILRRFLNANPFRGNVLHEIPSSAQSVKDIAFHAAVTMSKMFAGERYANQDFFEDLANMHPRKRDKIRAIARHWRVIVRSAAETVR